MSLFRYKIVLTGGGEKSGQITAKTEKAARDRIATDHSVVEWRWIKIVPHLPTVAAVISSKPKPLSKLGKMLYLQSGRCFFCGEPLNELEASIEHLNPLSKGGSKSEDNEVVCHKSLNATFGGMDLRRKFEFTLKAAGNFKCPKI